MATGILTTALQRLRSSIVAAGEGPTDGDLLEAFIVQRDEAAFTALVRRHGPMVLGVCRRLLGNTHDAEDAFQATFLVLVRKANSVSPRHLVGNWLHGVACRTAREVRRALARRRRRETVMHEVPHPLVEPETPRDFQPIFDEELGRLPEKFRAAVILCDLEQRTRREAARLLRLPEATLSNRLAKARRILAVRLARRGVTLAGTAVAVVSPVLLASTVEAATGTAAGVVSANVAALVEGVVRTMSITRFTTVLVAFLALGVLGVPVGIFTGMGLSDRAAIRAEDNPKKDKADLGPTVRGVLKSVDTKKQTITVAVQTEPGKKQTEEKTFDIAADVKVVLEEARSKDQPHPEGKLTEIVEGATVTLQLSADKKKVVAVSARGRGLTGHVKSVDAAKKTITIATKGPNGAEEKTFDIAKDAKVILDDGLGKKDKTKPGPSTAKEGKLTDLADATVLVQLSADGKRALDIHVLGGTVQGTLKGYDSGTRVLTVTLKEDGQVVDKEFKLLADAQVDGDLTAGARVSVRLSVFDKANAAGVRVIKDDKE